MYKFSSHGFIIILVTMLVCLALFFFSRKRIKNRIHKEANLTTKKYGIFGIIVGLVLAVISLIFHIYFQLDFIRTPELLKPLSKITAEPALLLTILAFLLGITIFFIGISSVRFRKQRQISEKK